VDIFKKLLPPRWAQVPFFQQCQQLEGIPVINVHLWFDRKLRGVDGLCFSRSPLLSVYADMSRCCEEYYDADKSMLELVFAPCSPAAGGKVNWIAKSDEEIVDACMGELARLFPLDVAPDPAWPLTLSAEAETARASAASATGAGAAVAGEARLRKHAVVKVPRSVYAALPGQGKFRPSQATPSPNFVLAGDWTSQKFLGSMEGAVLAGKLAAEVVADTAQGRPLARGGVKPVAAAAMAILAQGHHAAAARGAVSEVSSRSSSSSSSSSSSHHEGEEKDMAVPIGVRGDYPIAFGGGQQGSGIPYHP
jgi:15-cis-phytoene desaturase